MGPSRRAFLTAAGLALGVASSGLWGQSAFGIGARVFGLRLAYGEDAATSMIVTWCVEGPVTAASVRATDPAGRTIRAEASVRSVDGSSTRYCQASLTGLTPDTAYDYALDVDGAVLTQQRLLTAAAAAAPFRFTAFGDQGVTSEARAAVDTVARLAPRLHLVTGGLSYADAEGADLAARSRVWNGWLSQNEVVARSTPWMCALSEHEVESGVRTPGYADALARIPIGGLSPPDVGSATSFVVGEVGFVGLDSNDVSYESATDRGWTSGAQTRWLQEQLSAWRASGSGIEFIVAYLHHSAYTTNRAHPCEVGIRDAWGSLFDRYSVDLVLSAHNRCYERTLPIRARKPVPAAPNDVDSSAGTTYITVGGGGQPADDQFWPGNTTRATSGRGLRIEAAPWSLPSRTAEQAVLSVDVTPSDGSHRATMQVRAVAPDGQVLDDVTLHRGGSTSSGSADAREGWWIAGGTLAVAGGSAAVLAKLRRDWRTAADGG